MSPSRLQELDLLLSEPVVSVRVREATAFDDMAAEAENRIVLFGAGKLGRKSLSCLRGAGIEPVSFTDNSPERRGTKVDGLFVLSPEEATARYGASALFVVTIWSEGHRYTETHAKLSALGCKRIAPAASLRWKFADQLLPDYCQDLPHSLFEQADEVRAAAALWADDISLDEYVDQVRWRALGDHLALKAPNVEEQYFPDSLFSLNSRDILIDCGAFDGDTARSALARNAAFVVALEPDPQNFSRLLQWSDTLPPGRKRVESLNLAVGSSRRVIRWDSTGTAAACASAEGSASVQCITLDEIAASYAPTMVKMDIEGSELDALAGARQIIEQFEPILAICIYHRQSDMWRIPLFIASLRRQYSLYLRPHGDEGRETVCYAVPKHRKERGAA